MWGIKPQTSIFVYQWGSTPLAWPTGKGGGGRVEVGSQDIGSECQDECHFVESRGLWYEGSTPGTRAGASGTKVARPGSVIPPKGTRSHTLSVTRFRYRNSGVNHQKKGSCRRCDFHCLRRGSVTYSDSSRRECGTRITLGDVPKNFVGLSKPKSPRPRTGLLDVKTRLRRPLL